MMNSNATYLGFFDGAAEPNPGHGSAGWSIQDEHGTAVTEGHAYLGPGVTNNVAEYQALRFLLGAAYEQGCRRLLVRGDSQLIINQVTGDWQCKKPHLQEHLTKVQEWQGHFDVLQFMWVRREANTAADDLSKRALEEAGLAVADRDYQSRKAAAC